MALDYEIEKLVEKLKEIKPKRVLVQLPEGIKRQAISLQKIFNDLNIEAIFSGETCWGGCSISPQEAKTVGADLIVHFGHAKFIQSNFPILYIEIKDDIDLKPILNKSLEKISNYKTLGLAYSVQHKHEIENAKKFYEENNKIIISPLKEGYAAYPGHVVGCEFTGLKSIQDDVDAFIVIGNTFHSMGASLAVNKPVILLDIYNDKVTDMKELKDKIVIQRIISIDKFRHAKTVGLITEIKPGQKFGNPKFLKEKLENAGKQVIMISMSEITPDKLMNFYNIEAFVELGCPRIAIDDYEKYERTIITFKEALIAIGDKSFEEVLKNGLT